MCVDSEKQLTQLLVSLLSGAVAGVIATVVSQVALRFLSPARGPHFSVRFHLEICYTFHMAEKIMRCVPL